MNFTATISTLLHLKSATITIPVCWMDATDADLVAILTVQLAIVAHVLVVWEDTSWFWVTVNLSVVMG